MNAQTDPFKVIAKARPGRSMWIRVGAGPHDARPGILARFRRNEVEQIPESPTVEMRAGVIRENGVDVIPWMISIENREPWTFETWINVEGGREFPVPDLAELDKVPVLLFENDKDPLRTLVVNNTVDWKRISENLSGDSWTTEDYKRAREQVLNKYPTVIDLWERLE